MSTILLVEDDPSLQEAISCNLNLEKYIVKNTSTIKEALSINDTNKLDLVILDLNLPDGHGFTFLKQIRESGSRLPVLILTSQTHEDSIVEGLQLGANDYVRKPFSNKELIARIKAILREPHFRERQLRWADILILLEQRLIKHNEKTIPLNPREFDLLKILMERAETVLTRDTLLSHLDPHFEITDRTIDSHVSHLRQNLKKSGVLHIKISSVYGVGYRLEKVAG